MDRESMEQLRFDRRLARRRGWISKGELESELAALPDSAANATTLGEAADKGKPDAGDAAPAGDAPRK